MGRFTCSNCGADCCTCNGCNHRIAADGKNGCTKCIPQGSLAPAPLPQKLPSRPSLHAPGSTQTSPRSNIAPVVNRAYWTRNKLN